MRITQLVAFASLITVSATAFSAEPTAQQQNVSPPHPTGPIEVTVWGSTEVAPQVPIVNRTVVMQEAPEGPELAAAVYDTLSTEERLELMEDVIKISTPNGVPIDDLHNNVNDQRVDATTYDVAKERATVRKSTWETQEVDSEGNPVTVTHTRQQNGLDVTPPNRKFLERGMVTTQPQDAAYLHQQKMRKSKLEMVLDKNLDARVTANAQSEDDTLRIALVAAAVMGQPVYIDHTEGREKIAFGDAQVANTAALVQGDSALKGQSGFGGWGQPGLASARLQQQLAIQNALTSTVGPFRKPTEEKPADPPPANNSGGGQQAPSGAHTHTPTAPSSPDPAPPSKGNSRQILENAEERR